MIAEDVLRRCQMPPDEIGWILHADDPAIVHMIVELHIERLEEELTERRRALAELEAVLRSARHRATPAVTAADPDVRTPPSGP